MVTAIKRQVPLSRQAARMRSEEDVGDDTPMLKIVMAVMTR